MTSPLKEAAYVAVGLGVLGFQQAQVRRRELARQLAERQSELEARAREVAEQARWAVSYVAEQLGGGGGADPG